MNSPQFDPLAEALEFLRMSETAYYYAEFGAPWAFVMPENCPKFHVLTSGRCWLEVDGEAPRLLQTGDFAVIPHGKGHRLSSDTSAKSESPADVPCELISKRYAVFKRPGEGATTSLICGDLNFTHPAAGHTLSLLPKVMHVKASSGHSVGWLDSTLRFMAAEARAMRPGAETIITRLADVLVIQAIRAWIEQNPTERVGWLAALKDKGVSRAIAIIHRQPEKDWTIAALADAVAMSRSSFAERFSELVGEPVMQYLTRWRMYVALGHLKIGNESLEGVALQTGYQSAAAFSRAFKRFFGSSPGVVSRNFADKNDMSGIIWLSRTASVGKQSAPIQVPKSTAQRNTLLVS
jgi:AraC-like DNA-binding protein